MIEWLIATPVTVLLFIAARKLYQHWPIALLNPVLLCIVVISSAILLFDLKYLDYQMATMPIHYLLEPAVVALAYPLYTQFHRIKPVFLSLCLCSWVGISVATLSAFLLCRWFAAPEAISASMAALSVTTPITLLITELLGGIPAVAAIMVILIGVFGGVFGIALLSLLGVKQPQAKGSALGISCHAIGTAAALEHHPIAGAFASATMTISTLITALWVPMFYHWLSTITLF
ncbi:LrgB family protein [Pseudoalteromonas sp. T1lg65]|uniref:LrgB family protein n=1 Tax=Pseudoalteromonas sp. T1lg65 TaxID=2077101 RepID=UPI003F79B9FB